MDGEWENMGISLAGLSGGDGKVQKIEEVTTTESWTAPDDVDQVEVFLVGGGGSGSVQTNANRGGGGGGGGGEVVTDYISVTPGATYTITIGAGGGANVNSNTNHGSSTRFGNLAIARPGSGAFIQSNALGNYTTAPSNNLWASGGLADNDENDASPGAGAGGSPTPVYSQLGNTNIAEAHSIGAGPGSIGTGSQIAQKTRGGVGVMGFGGGGEAGQEFTAARRRPGATDGGGHGASSRRYKAFNNDNSAVGDGFDAGSGAINSGGGGGGGWKQNVDGTNNRPALTRPGGNGGSGIAIIKYWTEA